MNGGAGPRPAPAPTVAPGPTAQPASTIPRAAVPLKIGGVYPETGPLAPLVAAAREATLLAVADINAAGGDVTLTIADSATNPDIAIEAVDRLLAEGVHAIIGPAASGIVQAVIPTLYERRIPQCSPAAQDPALSTQENAAYFFRTGPSYSVVSSVTAHVVADAGATRVAILARDDKAGNESIRRISERLAELGTESRGFAYKPATLSFDAEVAAVLAYGPDAIVIAGFFIDGSGVIRDLLKGGFGPEMLYGTDTLIHPDLAEFVDRSNPNVLDGMTFMGVAAPDEFNERLTASRDGSVNFAGQSYDCIVLLALAAQAAGGTDGDAMLAAFGELTEGGVECRSYGECAALIAAGQDIDYVGVSGPLNFNAAGDPTVGSFGVYRFDNGHLGRTRFFVMDLTEFNQMEMSAGPESRPIEFPRDESPHRNRLEWWYYNGHLADARGDRYGFHFVVFQTRQQGLVTYIAHAAVTDLSRATRLQSVRVDLNEQPQPDDGFALDVAGWTLGGVTGEHAFTASTDTFGLDVRVTAVKSAAIHDEDGFLQGPDGEGWTYYYSWPRMSLTGTLNIRGEDLPVTGEAWMDHQWGDFDVPAYPAGWEWFGVQFEDGSEFMLGVARDAEGAVALTGSAGSLIRPDGTIQNVPADRITVETLGTWTSPHTATEYPSGWRISVPDHGLDVTLTPAAEDQEFNLGVPAGTAYWEGLVFADATLDGAAVRGVGYAELFGFFNPEE